MHLCQEKIILFNGNGLLYRGNDEDKRVPEHVRDENRHQASCIPVKPAPIYAADKGSKDKNGVAR